MRAWVMAGVAAVVLAAAGCSGGGPAGPDSSGAGGTGEPASASPSAAGTGSPAGVAAATPVPTRTEETCNGTPLLHTGHWLEVRGSSEDAEVWGLLFAQVPFEAGEEVKIVWRMTGEGPLEVKATGPGGKKAKLAWLEEHGGSNWQRPGHEWGTGWVFPGPGCWKVELSRTRGSGHAWLRVA